MTLINKDLYNSLTAEQMFLEAAMLLQTLEGKSQFNTQLVNRLNISISVGTKTANISATIPIKFIDHPTGGSTMYAEEYLATPNNTPINATPE